MIMTRKRNAVQKRKDKIRLRDRRRYEKRLVCTICGKITSTQIHHWFYSDLFDERSIIELCPECHAEIHGRDK